MCKNSCLRNKNKYIIIGNIAFASFISILIFIIFSFPTYAAKSLNVSNTSKIIKFFSLQSNLTATSKGLRIILKVLIYSGAVGTLGSLITSLRFSHNKFNKYLIIKIWMSALLKIVSLFGLMVTIASLAYAHRWTIVTDNSIFNLLRIMNILSYGLVVADSGFAYR